MKNKVRLTVKVNRKKPVKVAAAPCPRCGGYGTFNDGSTCYYCNGKGTV